LTPSIAGKRRLQPSLLSPGLTYPDDIRDMSRDFRRAVLGCLTLA